MAFARPAQQRSASGSALIRKSDSGSLRPSSSASLEVIDGTTATPSATAGPARTSRPPPAAAASSSVRAPAPAVRTPAPSSNLANTAGGRAGASSTRTSAPVTLKTKPESAPTRDQNPFAASASPVSRGHAALGTPPPAKEGFVEPPAPPAKSVAFAPVSSAPEASTSPQSPPKPPSKPPPAKQFVKPELQKAAAPSASSAAAPASAGIAQTVPFSWPAVTDQPIPFFEADALDPPFLGPYCRVFPETGYFACARCRSVVARVSSKVKIETSYSCFEKFTMANLTCDLKMGHYNTTFVVRCTKCRGFIGELVYGAKTATQALLRVSGQTVVHCPNSPPLGTPADGVFDDIDDVKDTAGGTYEDE